MDRFSFLGNGDVSALEDIFQKYKKDKSSVDQSWQGFFEGFEFARKDYEGDAVPENVQK
jgi:2-oxoglutarate dehydrogenase E1 component